jgi:4-amino-4-deoxychorismate lyase
VESTVCTVPTGTRLIETFGYRQGQGIAWLELHLARLKRSARALGFAFDPVRVADAIDALQGDEPLRCRLTLGALGDVEIATAELPAGANVPWVFRIAEVRLDSRDPFLRHKTTRRAVYDRWRAALPDGMHEWVFMNERGEVCEGTITNVSITTRSGARLTPSLDAGCLPGVYRESRLRKGFLTEAPLTLDDLRDAVSINLTNSLRGSTHEMWDEMCPFKG